MFDMTVKIFPATNGLLAFETVSELPHMKGKFIAGFAANETSIFERVTKYAGSNVNFVRAST
jgi:hypothetical protein